MVDKIMIVDSKRTIFLVNIKDNIKRILP